MARLFISYKREDEQFAFALRQWLMDEQNWSSDDIFVDRDQLRAGEAWAKEIFEEAENAQAMLFLASDAALHPDSFCYRELRQARGQVLAVTLGGIVPEDDRLHRALPYEALARQITALDQQPTEGFEFISPVNGDRGVVGLNRNQVESIGSVLRDLGIAPDSFDWDPKPEGPYPGLAPLQEGDEAIFFGRETEIRDGVRALEDLRGTVSQKLFVIQAPSGAGKSSFLRAGLWRRLRNHAGFSPLCIVRTAQGILSHPEWGLIAQLSEPNCNHLNLSKHAIAERVADDFCGYLRDLANADAGPDGPRTVLIGIDQAEEISDLSETEQLEFSRVLAHIMAAQEQLDIRLILTVRDDSLDAMLEQIEAAGMSPKAVRTERLHRLSPQRYREIIQGPAMAAQRANWPLVIETELEIALAEAAGSDRSDVGDALPLLAIALQRLVMRHRTPKGEIDLPSKDAADFLDAAVADTVNDALDAAEADHDTLKQLMIPRLATWDPNAGEGGAAKRQVATAKDLFDGARSALKRLADTLVDQRLLTRTQDDETEYYEVAHEALLRVPPMGEILYGLRENYILTSILKTEASDWIRSGKSEDRLARAGERLSQAQALLHDPMFGSDLKKPGLDIETYLEACATFATSEESGRGAWSRLNGIRLSIQFHSTRSEMGFAA